MNRRNRRRMMSTREFLACPPRRQKSQKGLISFGFICVGLLGLGGLTYCTESPNIYPEFLLLLQGCYTVSTRTYDRVTLELEQSPQYQVTGLAALKKTEPRRLNMS